MISDDLNFNSVESVYINSKVREQSAMTWNLKCFENNTFTKKINIANENGMYNCKLSKLNDFGKNRSITDIKFQHLCISDISWISGMTQILNLDLLDNNINNISSLSKLENLTSLNLSKNSIVDLTPLAEAIGNDEAIGYKTLDISYNSLEGSTVVDNVGTLLKLHKAGLQKVTITGNNFSEKDVEELKNGKKINGIDYPGFGEGNVIK